MKRKKAEYMKQYRLKRQLETEQRASNVQLQVESGDGYKLKGMEDQAPIDLEREVERKQK
jgi:aminoglycoside phosphotransferase